jgi:endonuclease/exonuclease/phosphatase (EEP) superfamily protein YafD
LLAILQELPHDLPVVVGGDFNEPGGDPLLRSVLPGLRDCFSVAGVGWGDTLINELPVWRVDQIWVSEHFRSEIVRARRTVNSDHRIVVCDLSLCNP